MMRATPALMAMPMMPVLYGQPVMPTTRTASFEDEGARPRSAERTCAGSQDRIDELDARVESLNQRLKTVQRAVELQTTILEELKAKGTIGGHNVPAKPQVKD